jgi:hypothetical protein
MRNKFLKSTVEPTAIAKQMKRFNTVLLALTLATTCITANAALLEHNGTSVIATGTDGGLNFDVSVVDGQAGYIGSLNSGTFGDGTILDYRFFNSPNATFNTNGYANGGDGIVGVASATNTANNDLNWADVWTTGDINSDPADFTSQTLARSQGIMGSINIAQLESGSLDFITGTFINSWTIALTMSGTGQSDVVAMFTRGNGPSVNTAFNSTFSFSDAALYDTISYTYTNTDTDGSRARFMGVVVDGVAVTAEAVSAPATLALLSLGLVGLGWSSRKKA